MWVSVVEGLWDQPHKAFVGAASLIVLALLAPVVRRHQPQKWLLWLMLYVVGIVVVIAISGLNGDSGSDAVVSLITALFARVYTQGHAARVLTWNQTQRRANEDTLTGALTRYGEEKWRKALVPTQSHGMVMACDIDDFKWFNDTWGHNAGDEVLKEVVKRFQRKVLHFKFVLEIPIIRFDAPSFKIQGFGLRVAQAIGRHIGDQDFRFPRR